MIFRIHSTNSVFNLILYSYNFETNRNVAACNCHPGQLCKAAADTREPATKMLAVWSSACVALALETSATATLKLQLTTGTSDAQLCHLEWMRSGLSARINLILIYGWRIVSRIGRHTHPLTSTRSHTSVCSFLLLVICLLTMATLVSGMVSGISWLSENEVLLFNCFAGTSVSHWSRLPVKPACLTLSAWSSTHLL